MIGSCPRWANRRMRLLELRLVGGLELGDGDLGLVLELLGALAHALVEGFVELAAGGCRRWRA